MIEHQVRLYSKFAAFSPDTFREWIGHEVEVTSLDPGAGFRHVLVGVENSEDGTESLLTIQTTRNPGTDLTADLSIRVGTPKAQIRAYQADHPDDLVTTAWLDAPLAMGQLVTINGARHTVHEITYPYRDPEHPEATEDYQRVVLQAAPDTPAVQALNLPMAGPLLGMLA